MSRKNNFRDISFKLIDHNTRINRLVYKQNLLQINLLVLYLIAYTFLLPVIIFKIKTNQYVDFETFYHSAIIIYSLYGNINVLRMRTQHSYRNFFIELKLDRNLIPKYIKKLEDTNYKKIIVLKRTGIILMIYPVIYFIIPVILFSLDYTIIIALGVLSISSILSATIKFRMITYWKQKKMSYIQNYNNILSHNLYFYLNI